MRGEAAAEHLAQQVADQLQRALAGLQRDVAGEAVGDHHVGGAGGDVVALDEADELRRDMAGAQGLGGQPQRVVAFQFLGADVQQADGGCGQPEHGAREHVAHHGELDQVARVALHVGAEVEQHHVAARRGADRRHGGPVDAGQGLDHDLRERQQRAGVAGGDHAGCLAAGHRVDRDAHRGAAHAQRRGGLGVVADRLGRVPDGAGGGGAAMALQQRVQLCLVADQQEACAGMALGGDLQTLDHHERRVIAAHGVHRQRVGRGQGRTRGHAAARASGANSALQRIAGRHDLAPVVETAMAADVVRPLQFAAIRALGVGLARERLVAATHAAAGRRSLSLGNGHGTAPLRSW